MTVQLALIFSTVTTSLGLPQGLLSALCFVESSHKVTAVNPHDGGSSSIGVCQMKESTAKMIGFKGTKKQLMEPKNNIFWAGRYLSIQMDRYDKDVRKAVAAYNAGTHFVTERGQTVNQEYVTKVFRAWSEGK